MSPWFQIFDTVNVDDCRAMNAKERAGIQASFSFGHARTHEERVATGVYTEVIASGFNPINVRESHEQQPIARPPKHVGYKPRVALRPAIEGDRANAPTRLLHVVADARECSFESCSVDWFEEKVECANVEGLHGALFCRRYDHEGWSPGPVTVRRLSAIPAHRLEEFKSPAGQRLDVEKDNIRLLISYRGERFGTPGTFDDDMKVVLIREERSNVFTVAVIGVQDGGTDPLDIGDHVVAVLGSVALL